MIYRGTCVRKKHVSFSLQQIYLRKHLFTKRPKEFVVSNCKDLPNAWPFVLEKSCVEV